MSAQLYVDRLVVGARPGFRAKLSRDWYVFRLGRKLPILGPFRNRNTAMDMRDQQMAKDNEQSQDESRKSTSVEEVMTTTTRKCVDDAREAAAPSKDADKGDDNNDE